MATYAEHILLRFGGTLGGDTWSCGLRLRGQVGRSDTATAEDNLEAVTEIVKTWHKNDQAKVNPLALLGWVKLNAINAQGRYAQEGDTNLIELDPPQGTGSQNFAPPQVATCITFRTAKTRGYARSGRMYVPAANMALNAGGSMSAGDALGQAQAMRTMLNSIAGLTILTVPLMTPAVFSDHAGEVNNITRVEVGTVLDTQQRRRRQLVEQYQGVDLA